MFWYAALRLSRSLAALGLAVAPWELATLPVADFDRLRALAADPPPASAEENPRGRR